MEKKRKTKIVATLGPSSSSREIIEELILAGVDVFRINFSHGTLESRVNIAKTVRLAANKLGKEVGLLGDLQGPKIRISKFKEGSTFLELGQKFIVDCNKELGDNSRVGFSFPALISEISANDRLVLDDGKIVLKVEKVEGESIYTIVEHGGLLSDNKGINRKGGGLNAPCLSNKDIEDIRVCADLGMDFLAVSFPKSGADIYMARGILNSSGSKAMVIAKIERSEAIMHDVIDGIIASSDGVMVARGDLAVEVGHAGVPGIQKSIIKKAISMNKLSIIATQMMESMISSPVPTRAEVSDVANAVLDGTDAVMLSAETAAGIFPVETVKTMDRVCKEAESYGMADRHIIRDFVESGDSTGIEDAIAISSVRSAYYMNASAIIALTKSGSIALRMSKNYNLCTPIYALSPKISSIRKMSLFRNVHPILVDDIDGSKRDLLLSAENAILNSGVLNKLDLVVITSGFPIGKVGSTNTMHITRIGSFDSVIN